ncbi:Fur family transcriptional regulator [soil metagenome]
MRRGCRLTRPRRAIARVLEAACDPPDVSEIHLRALALDRKISTATVYRTVKLLEDLKLVTGLRFGDGPARYEAASLAPHDHLIDLETGKVIEFRDARIEAIQSQLADELGYEIQSYRLEIFAVPAHKTDISRAAS